MAIDIVTHLLQTLSQTGIAFDEGALRSLLTVYRRTAEDFVAIYFADATIDGLDYDRHSEEALLGVFVGAIRTAIERFRSDPIGQPDLPNWIRVRAAVEDVGDRLIDIVRGDGGMLRP